MGINMKKTFVLAVMLTSASHASAGFFDSIFGKKEAAPVAETVVTKEVVKEASQATGSQATDTGSMVEMAMGLLPTLTQGLGVSNNQAEGGMGALLQLAQKNLTGDEFSSLSKGIPGIESMLSAVPSESQSASSGLGGMISSIGGGAGSMGALGLVTQQFQALGLSPDMVLKFAQMAIEYFSNSDTQAADQSSQGSDVGGLLQKGLSAILG